MESQIEWNLKPILSYQYIRSPRVVILNSNGLLMLADFSISYYGQESSCVHTLAGLFDSFR
jgi:hypothetical protein